MKNKIFILLLLLIVMAPLSIVALLQGGFVEKNNDTFIFGEQRLAMESLWTE